MAKGYALNLVSHPLVNDERDFQDLAKKIEARAPDIEVSVLPDAPGACAPVPLLPALTVSLAPLSHLRPLGGAVVQGRHLGKANEYRCLSQRGVAVPKWTRLLPGEPWDRQGFGEYVVVKPEFGGRGADVSLRQTSRVRWQSPKTRLARRMGGVRAPLIVQDFIYTGMWPISYRVATFFGKVLWCVAIEAARSRAPMPLPSPVQPWRPTGISIVSSGVGCTFKLCNDREVLALAERAHRAFHELPLLGVDVVRSAIDGRLYVLEVNSLGYTWHFSSPTGRLVQERFGLDLEGQFDGRNRAAELLCDQTRRRSR